MQIKKGRDFSQDEQWVRLRVHFLRKFGYTRTFVQKLLRISGKKLRNYWFEDLQLQTIVDSRYADSGEKLILVDMFDSGRLRMMTEMRIHKVLEKSTALQSELDNLIRATVISCKLPE